VWKILFQRLQAAKTSKYVAGLLGFLSEFVCQRGAAAVQNSIDGLQPGLFLMLVQSVWLPAMGTIKAHDQEKLLSVATTQVGLC
jgi:exportin-2 (importin alpha re-exporter)